MGWCVEFIVEGHPVQPFGHDVDYKIFVHHLAQVSCVASQTTSLPKRRLRTLTTPPSKHSPPHHSPCCQSTGDKWIPLLTTHAEDHSEFHVLNSSHSEYGLLEFELGKCICDEIEEASLSTPLLSSPALHPFRHHPTHPPHNQFARFFSPAVT